MMLIPHSGSTILQLSTGRLRRTDRGPIESRRFFGGLGMAGVVGTSAPARNAQPNIASVETRTNGSAIKRGKRPWVSSRAVSASRSAPLAL